MFSLDLLSRIEDASLNASAPPQQRWLDGWLVRYSPGKAKRARSINAVAAGRLPLQDKLRLAAPLFEAAGLPLVVRITPFSQPAGLDEQLAAMGMHLFDDTHVMVAALGPASGAETLPALPDLPHLPHLPHLPPGCRFERTDPTTYAQQVGALRDSPMLQRTAHAERLLSSPVPYEGWLLRAADGEVTACGQMAIEADLVGLYDVFTRPSARGQGLARVLCAHLLDLARQQGASTAYLQVDASNAPARAVYRHLGFADAYAYHYRTPDPAAA